MEPAPKKVYKEGEKAPGGITIENSLNKDDNTLPFGLFNPDTEGKLTWICNYGPDGNIISLFCYDHGDHTDRDVRVLKDLEEAKYARDELVRNGWRKLIPPKIAFTVSSDNGKQRPFSRKERRYLDRKFRQVARQQTHLQNSSQNREPDGDKDDSDDGESEPVS